MKDLFHNDWAAQHNALNPWLRLWYSVSSRCVTAGLELRVMILDVIQNSQIMWGIWHMSEE